MLTELRAQELQGKASINYQLCGGERERYFAPRKKTAPLSSREWGRVGSIPDYGRVPRMLPTNDPPV